MDKKELSDKLELVDASRVDANVELDFDIDETTEVLFATVEEIKVDLEKFTEKGNKQAGKRVRKYTKSLETIGRQFRMLSV